MTQPEKNVADRLDAVLADYISQVDRGKNPDRRAFLAAHPDLADDLAGYFEVQDRMERLAHTDHATHPTFGGQGPPGSPVLAATSEALPPGSLLGQYRLEEVIGEGAMGRIYRATHLHLDRVLAIKVLAPHLARDAQLVQRFHREAKALARLEHPHIVAIHDMGSQGEMHYFVMEYVPGVNLRQLMETGEVGPDRALQLVSRVCDALHFAHDRGIVHRDIKPENILIDASGQPRVADFGLAKVLQEENALTNLTGTNVVLGTYNYMAPEQKSSARVDHRADIYAVGVVLYELLTGKLPAGHFAPPSHAARVTPGVDQLVLKALHSEPEQRYQSAHELGSDITTELAGDDGRAGRPATGPQPAGRLRSLAIVESKTDQMLGTHEAAWVRLILNCDDDLEVRSWNRPEVGVVTDGKIEKLKLRVIDATSAPWTGTGADALPGLEIKLPKDDATVHVPEDLPVRVSGDEAEVTASGLRAALRIEHGEGKVKVRDHRGRLEVDRTESGALHVSGLQSEDFRLNTKDGRLIIDGLRFRRGKGSVHSDDGAVAVGVDEDACGFRYEARTLSGELTNDLMPDGPEPGTSAMKGTVGRGDAQLEIDTFGSDIHIGEEGEAEWVFDMRESGKNLFWAAIWIGAAFAFGFGALGWVLIWCWGIWALWEALSNAFPRGRWTRSWHRRRRRRRGDCSPREPC